MVQKASSPSSRWQRTAALTPMKINDTAASFSRSSPPPPPSHALCLSSVCLSLLVSRHLSPLHCPLFSSVYPSIYFFSVSILAPPLPLRLLILASCTHTDTLACNAANIKICAGWHSTFREGEGNTQSHYEDGVWLVVFKGSSANQRQHFPCGCLPLWLKLLSKASCRRQPLLQQYTHSGRGDTPSRHPSSCCSSRIPQLMHAGRCSEYRVYRGGICCTREYTWLLITREYSLQYPAVL